MLENTAFGKDTGREACSARATHLDEEGKEAVTGEINVAENEYQGPCSLAMNFNWRACTTLEEEGIHSWGLSLTSSFAL